MTSERWYRIWPTWTEFVDVRDEHGRLTGLGSVYGSRGPFKSPEQAESFRWRDRVPGYWEWGMTVWADHCGKCGRWAKVLAGDNGGSDGLGWTWVVTECSKCGMVDSRVLYEASPHDIVWTDGDPSCTLCGTTYWFYLSEPCKYNDKDTNG